MRVYICVQCEGDILPGLSYKCLSKGKVHKSPSCNHAGSKTNPSPFLVDEEVRVHVKHTPRLLGTEIRKSRELRNCNYCENHLLSYISEGEEYERQVWVEEWGELWNKKRAITVKLKHFPECPIPWDEPDEEGGISGQKPRAEVLPLKKKLFAHTRRFRRAA